MSSHRSPLESSTWVGCLTPPGVGAIATLALVGPKGWPAIRTLFQGRTPLPPEPTAGRTWHGWLGAEARDDVVISADPTRPRGWVEIHCHGGVEVVNLLLDYLGRQGIATVPWQRLLQLGESPPLRADACIALSGALTLRTADILLGQAHGALANALTEIVAAFAEGDDQSASSRLQALAHRAPLGRHLTRPWRMAIAGAPNVGKSSLMNALAGYQRSIVAPTAGTTRDVVSALLAFEGWPFTIADTAGIRATQDPLENAGVLRARRELDNADLCLWILDGGSAPSWPEVTPSKTIFVINKTDLPAAWNFSLANGALCISARTGQGIPELTGAVARALVPDPPKPGEAIPFCDSLCDAIEQAWKRCQASRHDEAQQIIHQLLAGGYQRETLQGA